MKSVVCFLFGIFLAFFPEAAGACDPCALYNASRIQNPAAGDLTLAVSEQYTDFDRPGGTGPNSVRDGEFVEGFSTTQIAAAFSPTERFGLQLNLPILARRVEKLQSFRRSNSTESGLGDLSLIVNYTPILRREISWSLAVSLFGGIKFPTGDTGVLEDFSQSEDTHSEGKVSPKHHTIGAVSGGRALAFGTGSYDFIGGTNLFTRFERFMMLGSLQYTLKTEGDFNYEFADDVIFSLVPAYYFVLEDEFSLAGGMAFSGEFKGMDHRNDLLVSGSGISNLYLGPDLIISTESGLGVEAGIDFRVSSEDTGATVVPEIRFRGSIFYRF